MAGLEEPARFRLGDERPEREGRESHGLDLLLARLEFADLSPIDRDFGSTQTHI